MKRAVSVSIGSSKRDKVIEIELIGEQVLIERIGTDGQRRGQPTCIKNWMGGLMLSVSVVQI
jgi:hypothetical protein